MQCHLVKAASAPMNTFSTRKELQTKLKLTHTDSTVRKTAFVITAVLVLIALTSLLWIWLMPSRKQEEMIADIYQNGVLIQSIPLSSAEAPYCFTVTGPNHASNEIQVGPNGIGIISANCPDCLCVKQGFIDTSLLPITCLPNRLVIRLRPASSHSQGTFPQEEAATDIITY